MNTRIANRYTVIDELGTGGMGTVYKAVDDQTRQLVAIKQLHEHLTASELIERFKREGNQGFIKSAIFQWCRVLIALERHWNAALLLALAKQHFQNSHFDQATADMSDTLASIQSDPAYMDALAQAATLPFEHFVRELLYRGSDVEYSPNQA